MVAPRETQKLDPKLIAAYQAGELFNLEPVEPTKAEIRVAMEALLAGKLFNGPSVPDSADIAVRTKRF